MNYRCRSAGPFFFFRKIILIPLLGCGAASLLCLFVCVCELGELICSICTWFLLFWCRYRVPLWIASDLIVLCSLLFVGLFARTHAYGFMFFFVHSHKHTGDTVHIRDIGFTWFHWSTRGSNRPRNASMCQQIGQAEDLKDPYNMFWCHSVTLHVKEKLY